MSKFGNHLIGTMGDAESDYAAMMAELGRRMAEQSQAIDQGERDRLQAEVDAQRARIATFGQPISSPGGGYLAAPQFGAPAPDFGTQVWDGITGLVHDVTHAIDPSRGSPAVARPQARPQGGGAVYTNPDTYNTSVVAPPPPSGPMASVARAMGVSETTALLVLGGLGVGVYFVMKSTGRRR